LVHLDGRLWNVEDTREAIGLPCIGSLPDISSTLTNVAAGMDDARAAATFQEVLRSLVAELHLADPACDIKTLLITSSVEREGRTTLANGLAACLACLGRKAIVVDCDFRHENLLQQHGADEHVEEMRDVALAQLTEHADAAGHDVLQLPRCGIDPMALFASGRLQDLFATLRRTYDSVVIDGPPILIASEARLLPALADATIIAVRWGSTDRSDVLSALAAIRGVGFGCRVEIDEHVTVMTCRGDRRTSRSVLIAASRRTS
jgi:polysaccharide biosynthesis transport protein